MPVTAILTAGREELTLGPFENVGEAADAVLARPDIDTWETWRFLSVARARQDWEPPNLDHLGQYNNKYQEGV